MTYNPDDIDDRTYEETRRLEQELMRELRWRTEREINDTRTLCEQIRELVKQIDTIG